MISEEPEVKLRRSADMTNLSAEFSEEVVEGLCLDVQSPRTLHHGLVSAAPADYLHSQFLTGNIYKRVFFCTF